MEDKEKIEVEQQGKKGMSNGLKILLVILGVALVGIIFVGAFTLGRNVAKWEEKEEEKKEPTEEKTENENDDQVVEEDEEDIELEKLTKDSAVVKKLFEAFREDKNCLSAFWDSDSQEFTKKYIAYYAIDDTAFKEVKCGDLDDSYDDGLYCAMNEAAEKYYSAENEKGFENAIKDETTKGVDAATLQLKYKELFGAKAKMEHDDFSIGYGPIAHYDKVNNLYAEFHCMCGGECVPATHTLEKIEQEATKLILYTKFKSDDEEKDESITYTFKYEKETGNYIFVSRVSK